MPVARTSMVSTRFPAAASVPSPVAYQYPSAQPYYGAAPQQSYPGFPGYSLNPQYVTTYTPSSNLATILGGFGDVGVLANLVAQAVAAFLPLPSAPTPADPEAENQAASAAVNSSNLIRYQSALAQFARRDQQILTIGSALKELFKRPGTVG